jgi:hypothetical protein
MITMLAGCCLVLFVVVLGLRHYRAGVPLAGSCSVAISAACHGSNVDTTVPLQWGVTSDKGAEHGHCAFSDQEIDLPIEGALYAGLRKRF